MYKMLFITEKFEPFRSSFGSMAVPQPYEAGWTMPLGWEDELTERSIEFTEIELPTEDWQQSSQQLEVLLLEYSEG